MAKYANQKTITINRDIPERGKGQFLQIYNQNIAQAARDLTAVGFKLYLYFASNQKGYEKDYSPRDFANIYGVSYESARKAPQNLVDNGYLVIGDKNTMEFFETPQETQTKIKIKPAERRLIEQEDNTYKGYTFKELYDELKDELSEEEIREQYWNTAEVCE